MKLKQRGLTVTEYAIAGVLISVAVVGAFTGLGDTVGTSVDEISNTVAELPERRGRPPFPDPPPIDDPRPPK